MYEDILEKIGLTKTQAKIYLTLVKNGPLSPTDIAGLTNETRTNAYAVSEKLVKLGLAKKDDSKKMIISPESPEKIRYILSKKQQRIKSLNNNLSLVMPDLLSAFLLNNNVANIINISGREAIMMIYDSILNTKEDVFLLSNGFDYKCEPNLLADIKKRVKELEKAKIKTYILVQSDRYDINHPINPFQIAKPLPDNIKLDVRIIIFGEKTVLSIFKEDNVNSTIISSPEITNSMKSIFISLWNSNPTSLPGHPDKNMKL